MTTITGANFNYIFNLENYTFVDLPQVNLLISKFLDAHNVNFNYELKTLEDDFTNIKIDLALSNYAFSELNYDLQEISIKKIVNKSKYSYMTINSDSFSKNKKYKKLKFLEKNELLIKINNSTLKSEKPLTADGNYKIISNNSL